MLLHLFSDSELLRKPVCVFAHFCLEVYLKSDVVSTLKVLAIWCPNSRLHLAALSTLLNITWRAECTGWRLHHPCFQAIISLHVMSSYRHCLEMLITLQAFLLAYSILISQVLDSNIKKTTSNTAKCCNSQCLPTKQQKEHWKEKSALGLIQH